MVDTKIFVKFPDHHNKQDIEYLVALINNVYEKAETGLFVPGVQRITNVQLNVLVQNNNLMVAELAGKIVGCIAIYKQDINTAMFGMLVSHPDHRGIGIGSTLISAAEAWARENNCIVMHLELLAPKNWTHDHKEFLKSWYIRLGYEPQITKKFEKEDILVTEYSFTIYEKILKK